MSIIRPFPTKGNCSCAHGFYNSNAKKQAANVQHKPLVIPKISNIQTHHVVWKNGKY